jgi:DNA polymerase III subunit epsilon
MTTALFYKCHTTSLIDWQAPSEASHQPNIVRLSANLTDLEARRTIASMNVIVRPTKWKIPEEATAINGIDTGYALAVGIPESLVAEMLYELWSNASVRIAYTEAFDARVVRIALTRYHKRLGIDPDKWKAGTAESLQGGVTVSDAAGKTRKATMDEAYVHFFSTPRAAVTLTDADVCQAIYFALKGNHTHAKA